MNDPTLPLSGQPPADEDRTERLPAQAEPTHRLEDPGEKPVASAPTTIQERTKPIAVAPPPRAFGDYELLEEVGRGGMGVVYRARQESLDRVVALKMILGGRLAHAEDVQRFRTEAEAAAKLSHPHIVAVHDVGEIDGQHFFSMEFIEGVSLAHRLENGPLPGKSAARYVAQIARAVHHAHRVGILHRDLKPSNIMIDADDMPHITDFGLAKRLGGDSGQTRTGAILGTPSYMAPEQAQGRGGELGPVCDIYSLGAILYELITGRPPFRAETPFDTIGQVLSNQPVPPRLLNPNVDGDLETICLKCLEKDGKDRYSTALALAEDLERYLVGESINARSFNVLDRLTRMLEHSRNATHFHTWSTMILIVGLVVGVEHLIVYFLHEAQTPRWTIMAARTLQFVVIGLLFWYNRGSRLLPTSMAERELWTIWIGYFCSYGVIILGTRLMLSRDLIEAALHLPERMADMLPYPFVSACAGLAFFAMGSNYWGKCYLIGVGFFALGAVMPLRLDLAPLLFGLVWALALFAIGVHLRQVGRKVDAETATDPRHRETIEMPRPPSRSAK
jgi:serine/threonine protein kinase